MTRLVSYVSDEAIEKDAQALLAEYAHAREVTIEAPIAIDDIIEKHLKIVLERLTERHRVGFSALVWHGQTASPRRSLG